jgi:pimeloyl-ACP methyl ester carboxylesterase
MKDNKAGIRPARNDGMDMREQIVLMPGLLCDGSVFTHQIAALSRHADVKVADFLGQDSIEGMARHALGLFEGPVSLVGFSMGGRAAFQAIRLRPERIRRLCLMDTGATPARENEPEMRRPLIDLAHAEGMGALAARWLPPMLHADREQDPALIGPLTAMVKRATPDQHERQIRALLSRPDARPVLAGIRCPVLVMVGRQDRWSTQAQHEELAAAIPGAELAVIEDAGHFVSVERPEAVTRALMAWFGFDRAEAA